MTHLLVQDAKDELKRADHMLYISLKYTRTRDVMRNIIFRLIAAFDLGILALLEKLKENKKLINIPKSGKEKVEILSRLKRNSKEFLELYVLLKRIEECSYTAREEYRKHVTMISNIAGKKLEIDVPLLTEYFKKTNEFINYVEGELH